MNQGYVGAEIAEMIQMPTALDDAWHTRGYYGSVNHNVKAIYQRYLGWYDGNPAHLWQHPPEALAARYVDALGGVPETLAKARSYAEQGDLRFAAELASHAVFVAPDDTDARHALAAVLTQLGYGSECATWRNCYLLGADELVGEIRATALSAAGLVMAMTTTQLFDAIAIRIDGPRAAGTSVSILWHLTDEDTTYRMELSNGALVHHPTTRKAPADLDVTLTHAQLAGLVGGAGTDGVQLDGDAGALSTVLGLVESPDPNFHVVTP
jgi:alkyl sulfatase BDS1-like metallo-beta-lactamase superfamily hydrolase